MIMTRSVSQIISFATLLLFGVLLLACSKSLDNEPTTSATGQAQPEKNSEKVPAQQEAIDWPDNVEPSYVSMELKQVSPHIYYVEGPPGTPTDNEGFMSNAGVVVTDAGVVVFDALGTPSLAYKLYTKIKALTDKPVVKVVVSHYHADHIYGLQVFKEAGAEIIAPAGAKVYLASDAAEGRLKQRRESLFPWVNENTYLVKPDRFVDEDTEITVGDVKLQLLVLGSTHSEGDLMMRVKPDNVLFSGDLVFEGRIPFVAGSNPDGWLTRLSELDTSNLTAIIPGHGTASSNPQQAMEFTKGYLEYLYRSMGDAVDNLTSFDEAYKQTDWSRYNKLPAFLANRTNAYFIYLRLEAASMQ